MKTCDLGCAGYMCAWKKQNKKEWTEECINCCLREDRIVSHTSQTESKVHVSVRGWQSHFTCRCWLRVTHEVKEIIKHNVQYERFNFVHYHPKRKHPLRVIFTKNGLQEQFPTFCSMTGTYFLQIWMLLVLLSFRNVSVKFFTSSKNATVFKVYFMLYCLVELLL